MTAGRCWGLTRSRLGTGGMGQIPAHATRGSMHVAIKVLAARSKIDAARARVHREALVLAGQASQHRALRRPRGERPRSAVMELVEGPTLAERPGRPGGRRRNESARGSGSGRGCGGARRRRRPLRPEAGESQVDAGRRPEDPRFRHCEASPAAGDRRHVGARDAHVDGEGGREHAPLHGSRAVARRTPRRPDGHLGGRRRLVRDGHRKAAVRGLRRRARDGRDPPRGAGFSLRPRSGHLRRSSRSSSKVSSKGSRIVTSPPCSSATTRSAANPLRLLRRPFGLSRPAGRPAAGARSRRSRSWPPRGRECRRNPHAHFRRRFADRFPAVLPLANLSKD